MTNDEKLNALLGCVYTSNCCVTGFQTEPCFEKDGNATVRLYFANGLVMEVKTEDLTLLHLPTEEDSEG